ncbi:MAG: hypothetical protein V3R83_09950 [Gammaproteobacteria bacterium]
MARKKMEGMRLVNFNVSGSSWDRLGSAATARFTTRSHILRDMIEKTLCRFGEEDKLKRLMAKGA